MKSINRVMVLGHLGSDPETRAMPSGRPVANLRIATSERWKDKQTGEQKEQTEWHNVVFFDRRAEVVQQYLHKGSRVLIEGQLRTRKWQDKQGNDRYTTEIVASELQMLGGKGGGDSSRAAQPASGDASSQSQQTSRQGTDFNDDIPF